MCESVVIEKILTINIVLYCCKTQNVREKVVDECCFTFEIVSDYEKAQKICKKTVSKDSFALN